mgnify:CR=1 FL=1
MGFKLYGTKGTAAYLNNYGLHVEPVNKISEPGKNNIYFFWLFLFVITGNSFFETVDALS